MPRPASLDDIEVEQTEFATVDMNLIADRGDFLKAYAVFVETIQRLGGSVDARHTGRVKLSRPATLTEQHVQLEAVQHEWDQYKKFYDQLAELGSLEYDYQRQYAKIHAEREGLPFPPPHEPISDYHATLANIDEALIDNGRKP